MGHGWARAPHFWWEVYLNKRSKNLSALCAEKVPPHFRNRSGAYVTQVKSKKVFTPGLFTTSLTGSDTASTMSRQHKFMDERKKIEPKPTNCKNKQRPQDVNTVFQKLQAAGSDITATLDLTVFVNGDYECLKPLVLKLLSAPASSATCFQSGRLGKGTDTLTSV